MNKPWLKFYDNIPEYLPIPDLTLYESIKKSTDEYPDNIALEYMGANISHRFLLDLIDKAAGALTAQGVKSGDCVLLSMPNIPNAVILFYAINKIGARIAMTHPLSSSSELKHYISETDSVFAVTVDMFYDRFKDILAGTNVKKLLITHIGDYLPPVKRLALRVLKGSPKLPNYKMIIRWDEFMASGKGMNNEYARLIQPEDPSVILFSGGTSDLPKGILLTSCNFNALPVQMQPITGFSSDDSIMAILPLFHGFGLGLCLHTALYLGAKSILVPQFSSKEYIKILKKHQPSFIAGVPTLFEALLRNKDFKKVRFDRLKGAYCGADSLPPALKKKFDECLFAQGSKVELMEGYGLTETVTGCVISPQGHYKPNSMGIPTPNTLVKIVKEGTTEDVPFGEIGEICISGPILMTGYLNDEVATSRALRVHADGTKWLHTGDIGYMDEDGYIFFKSRLKRVIKVSGMSVFPAQVEAVIRQHPEIAEVCVVGIADKYQMTSVKAFIVLKDKKKQSDEALKQDILDHCRKELLRWSVPKHFQYIDELPKTLVGKIAYTKLQSIEPGSQTDSFTA